MGARILVVQRCKDPGPSISVGGFYQHRREISMAIVTVNRQNKRTWISTHLPSVSCPNLRLSYSRYLPRQKDFDTKRTPQRRAVG